LLGPEIRLQFLYLPQPSHVDRKTAQVIAWQSSAETQEKETASTIVLSSPLELQMANIEIMEISMARNTDEKSSTEQPV
jgi:hypothetical protein